MEADILALSPAMLNLIWIGLFIILLIIEVFTVGLTTIWFAIGALAAAGVNTLGANLIIQVNRISCRIHCIDDLYKTMGRETPQ